MNKTNYIPFGLHDSHTSADLKALSDQEVNLQVPFSALGFHTQKTMHKRNRQIEHNRFQIIIKLVNDNVYHFKTYLLDYIVSKYISH